MGTRRDILKGISGLAGLLPVFGTRKFKVCELNIPGVDTSNGVALLRKPARIVTPSDFLQEGVAEIVIRFPTTQWHASGYVTSVEWHNDVNRIAEPHSWAAQYELCDPGELTFTCKLVDGLGVNSCQSG